MWRATVIDTATNVGRTRKKVKQTRQDMKDAMESLEQHTEETVILLVEDLLISEAEHKEAHSQSKKSASAAKESKEQTVDDIKKAVAEGTGGGGWKFPFFILFAMILALAGVGYNRYTKLYGKSHLP